jgi:hypothetical protein
LDKKVAQIYVSTDSGAHGNTYDRYLIGLAKEYGSPDDLETRQNRNVLVPEIPGQRFRWSKDGQYITASGTERAITIGSESLDVKIDELERLHQF